MSYSGRESDGDGRIRTLPRDYSLMAAANGDRIRQLTRALKLPEGPKYLYREVKNLDACTVRVRLDNFRKILLGRLYGSSDPLYEAIAEGFAWRQNELFVGGTF